MALIDPADVPLPAGLAIDEPPPELVGPANAGDDDEAPLDFRATLDAALEQLGEIAADGGRSLEVLVVDSLAHEPDEGTVSPLPPQVRGWRISDDEQAEWAARRLAGAVEELERREAQRAAWVGRIDAWFERVSRRARGTAAYMTAQLEDYALRVRRASGDEVKRVDVPSALVQTRAQPAAVEVVDAEAFVAWALEALPEAVRRDPKPAPVSEIRQLVSVAEQTVEWLVSVVLECGHEDRWTTSDEDQAATYDELEPASFKLACRSCPGDAIDGPPERRAVALEVRPLTQPRVLYEGEPVPGLRVREASASAKVALR